MPTDASDKSTTTTESTDASTTSPSAATTPNARPTTTTRPTTTPSTAPPAQAISIPIPEGSFTAAPTDLYVLAVDGDLELWSGATAATPTQRITVVDYPNPFGPVTEGPGPNVIDQVAGEIGGTVVFGDCCEPVAGNIRVATAPGQVRTVGFGYSPTRSPRGDLLGTANDFQISQTSTRGDGEGILRLLDQHPFLHVADLTWTSNATPTAADDHLVLLGWTPDDGWAVYDVDRTTLEPTKALDLGIAPVPEAPDVDVRFAGTGPEAEIVVAESNSSTTRLRYLSPTTLAELPSIERSLPASATSIRVSQEDLLWVDSGDVLHLLRGGTFEPVRLGNGVIAAWYP